MYFRCTLPPTSYARDIYENIKLGNVSQCSFGMVVDSDGDSFERRNDGIFKRTINKIQSIFDCSVVSFPAYNSSSVEPALRSIEHIKQEETNKIEEQRKLDLAKLELELLRLKK